MNTLRADGEAADAPAVEASSPSADGEEQSSRGSSTLPAAPIPCIFRDGCTNPQVCEPKGRCCGFIPREFGEVPEPQSCEAIIDEYVGVGNDVLITAFIDGLMRTIQRLRKAEIPESAILAGLAVATSACIEGAVSLGKINKRFAQALAREVAESAGLDDTKVRELCE